MKEVGDGRLTPGLGTLLQKRGLVLAEATRELGISTSDISKIFSRSENTIRAIPVSQQRPPTALWSLCHPIGFFKTQGTKGKEEVEAGKTFRNCNIAGLTPSNFFHFGLILR